MQSLFCGILKNLFLDFIVWFCPFCLSYVKDSDATAVQRELERLIFGIYSVSVEGGDATTPPADVGIVIEGVEVLPDLGDVASACALLMGVIYALNLSYPQELKAFFEVLQKFFLQLDDCRLSTKDSDATAVQRELERLIFGIYSVSVEGGDATTPPADVGIVIEGVEVLPDLGDVASACALLMGVIYALNLSYPQELKAFFEVLQKFFLQLDDCRLSTKDSDATAVQRELERLIFGIYSVSVEGGDATTPPADVGIVIEGVEVLPDLGDVASACALLMGVIYALNLSYPQELKAFFEVLQKFFLQLDDCRLSTKDSDATAVQRELERLIFGIYSVSVEGGDATTPPADVGIVIEGVEVLPDLGDVASACALLMGVIYALNLSYPQELKAFFEVLQKFFLQLDDCRLSTKVQMLKNKLYESANQ
ncbi:uncharacterized protein [Trachinotus anak]|uniref:uncharacterized protein isoform X1 n=1 Tax=Trachinotus anak TaxID=443729 RepID=UPI0039F19EF9